MEKTMSTITPRFEINGVISTDKTVMQNLNSLCTSAGCWMTYDIALGKWSVIINGTGTSVAAFTDSNIMGGINISGSGINELYNAVTIEFPHKDLRDQTDYIDLEIASADRYPNELDNRLNISLDSINDPIQAQYIATAELKQSRVDKIIEFRTDYTRLGLKAGDLIDITSEQYGYTSKVFRILKMEEADEEGLVISITALEYDAAVYDTTGLIRKERNKKTGIVPKDANEAITASDAVNTGNQFNQALNNGAASLALGALTPFYGAFKNSMGGSGFYSTVYTFTTGQINLAETLDTTSDQTFFSAFGAGDRYDTGYSTTIPYTGTYKIDYFFNFGIFSTYDGSGNWISPNNVRKRVRPVLIIGGSDVSLGAAATTTAGKGDDPFTDLAISASFTATRGSSCVFKFDAKNTMGPNNATVVAMGGFASAAGIVFITGTLTYIGA